jgi:thiol-disulfide isomerase/thioredoxin
LTFSLRAPTRVDRYTEIDRLSSHYRFLSVLCQLRKLKMRQHWTIAGVFALGVMTSIGAVGLPTARDDEPKAFRADEPKPVAESVAERPEVKLVEKLDRVKTAYESAQLAYQSLYRGSTIPEENRAKAAEIEPSLPAVVRRIGELAATAPKSPAVRDAMLWVIGQASAHGSNPGEFGVAATWLVRHHGDDPDAVRVGLELDNWPTADRDHLLLSFYASAKRRESKGLARLALAQYLERKAKLAEGARKMEGRPTYTHDDLGRADRTLYTEKEVMPDQEFAYLLHLKQCDVNYLRVEAERLYEEVIAEYGDVPYITARDRMLEDLLKQAEPKWHGKPLTEDGRRGMERRIAHRRSTLGQIAVARLDDWHNLAVGKLAPEINGVDVHGKPLKLSTCRGKVVALVFWNTGCGPCMRQIPREKDLVERMNGRPFAMLGVNNDADAGTARKVMQAQGVTWPNWYDDPAVGSIIKLYHVRGYPTIYVIDANGKIRSKDSVGEPLDQLIEKLVAEKESAGH